ncbi:MAG: putative diguanylate cyclase [Microbacteriaceae bacterium]|jgi:hypothetical protein|nr:putative diguanylate cyclase [Microbacteriaceae bacterium]
MARLALGALPTDDPRAHSAGLDPDRVLLFGTGASVGWGVTSHELGLPGSLARSLTARTGRGADVEVIAAPSFSASQAIHDLRDASLSRYDVIVLTLGLTEAAGFANLADWRRHFDELLDFIRLRSRRDARIYALGVHSTTKMTVWDHLLSPAANAHRRSLNSATAAECVTGARAAFIPFDPPRQSGQGRSRQSSDYRDCAEIIAEVVAPTLGLDGPRDRRQVGDPDTEKERRRQSAVDSLAIVDTPAEARFDRIVALARRAFGTEGAAMTIIDNDRQWAKSIEGDLPLQIERSQSYCAVTIESPGAFVVADLRATPVDGVAGQDQNGLGFYAGYPIEAPSGDRIGALCVYDAVARDPADVDVALLRDLALMAQNEVWQRWSGVTRR